MPPDPLPRGDDRRGDRSRTTEPALVLAGRALQKGRIQPIELGIDDDGWIVRLGRNLRGAERLDLGEKVIVPAAADLHVHFRDPDVPPAADSFPTGTVQAALGGVALVGEMPNTHPAVVDAESAVDKARRAHGRIGVDVLLYGAAITPGQVGALARHVGAFKLYLAPTTGVPEAPDLGTLAPLLDAVASTGLPLAVHAEDPRRFAPGAAATDPVGWNRERPIEAEREAVGALLAAVPPSLRLHVAHVTTAEVAERLRVAGHSFEATPHHLLLSDRSFPDARGKVNPPLRSAGDQRRLLAEFEAGRVPCLASDHAPHGPVEKERPFPLAASGVPGVETLLPLFLHRVRTGDLPLATLLQSACERPARWLGRPHGRLAVGHRAYLLAVDFRRSAKVAADRLHAPCGWSAFEGFPVIFPTDHFRGTTRLVEGGEFVGAMDAEVVRPEFARSGALGRAPGTPEEQP